MLKEDLVLEYASDLFCEECKSLLAKDPYLNVSLTLRDFTMLPTSFPPSLGMFARSKRDISILYVILLIKFRRTFGTTWRGCPPWAV